MKGEQISEVGQPGNNSGVAGNWTQHVNLGNPERSAVHRIPLVRGEEAEFPVMRGTVQDPRSWKKQAKASAVLPQLCVGARAHRGASGKSLLQPSGGQRA